MAQSRKKAILAQVEKQRRRNRIVSLAAIVLVAVVVAAVFIALPKTGIAVPLPGYLDRCPTGSIRYHAHPNPSIVINGSSYTIPASLGIGACNKPIHTHDTTGTLHVETDANQDYKLSDVFLVWGNWENNPQRVIFNSTQIFGAQAVSGHTLTMTVNGNPDTAFQNYVIPRNAESGSNPCSTAPCQSTAIVITYA